MAPGRVDSLFLTTALSAIGGCAAVAAVACWMTPPAVAMADRYLTLTAILIASSVVTSIVTARRPTQRPERLAAVVALLATLSVWYALRQWVHEKQFDYLVREQKQELELEATELSGDIENFLHERLASAPPRPSPATWDRDVNASLDFESETAMIFDASFTLQVRRTRDQFALEGLVDRDLDTFYRHPANAFQIDVVARKLALLAHRLERH